VGYRAVRRVIRLLLGLFYRRIDVLGAERIPPAGPLLITANHHNSIVDAMLILGMFPRRVTVLANAPLFRHPFIGPFLWTVGAVPVHRRAEAGDDPAKNAAMFAAVTAALRAGGAVLIFPEGRTQPRPTLLPLRTGAARILLETEAGPRRPGTVLLPVGLVFERPGTFREASAIVSIGPPVATDDTVAAHARAPEDAVRQLTARLAEAIRAELVEAEDQHTLELLSVLEDVVHRAAGAPPPADPAASLAWRRRAMAAARELDARAPERVAELRRRLEQYRARLDETGLTDGELDGAPTSGAVLRWVVANAVSLLVSLPLALVGLAAHAAPYWLTGVTVRRLRATEEELATDKMAVGLVLYPACWAVESWVVWRLAGGWGVLVGALCLVPSGLVALAWRARLARVARQLRGFGGLVADRRLHGELLAERDALARDVAGL
jgi:glycerol-3-phosphate O-acyltransferase / dihydroxyacetone phosphate acyltransferase